jgi:tetratricopeptide (TPR) repeat protein
MYLAQMQTELDNLRAALAYARDTQQTENGLRLGAALGDFWYRKTYILEGFQYLEGMLALPGADKPTLQRAKVLIKLGPLARQMARFAEAEGFLEEALLLAQQHENKPLIAAASRELGLVCSEHGNLVLAQQHNEAALHLYRELADSYNLAITLSNLAITFIYQEKRLEARPLFEESAAIYKTLGYEHTLAVSLSNLGAVCQELGDLGASRRYYEESLAVAKRSDNKEGQAYATANLASLAQKQSDPGSERKYLTEAVTFFLEANLTRAAVWSLVNVASLELREGYPEEALQLVGMVEEQAKRSDLTFPAYHQATLEEIMAEATQELDPIRATVMREEGRTLTFAGVLAKLKTRRANAAFA